MSRQSRRSRKLIYVLGVALGFFCATAYVLHAVFTSTSSTAAIGLLFVPVYGLCAAVIGWAVVYVGFAYADALAGRLAWQHQRVTTASGLLVLALLFSGAVLLYRDARATAADPQAGPAALLAVSQRWIPLWRRDVDEALAKNPATPAAVLTAMVEEGSDNYLVSLAGAHPHTPLPVLEKIAAGPLTYDRVAGLAGNPRITPALAERLANVSLGDFEGGVGYKVYQTYVLGALVKNPATPQAVFDRLAAREAPEYFLSVAIIYADRSTCAQIARAGSTGSDVLYSTAQAQLKKRGC